MVDRPTNDMIALFMSYFLSPKSSLEFGGIGAKHGPTDRFEMALAALAAAQVVQADPEYDDHPAGRRRYIAASNHTAFVRAVRTRMQTDGFDNPFKWVETFEKWHMFERNQTDV